MDLHVIYKKESENNNNIYMYVEKEDICCAYGFSAYLLTRLFGALKLKEEKKSELGTIVFVTQLSIQFVVDNLSGPNTSVGDDFIRVIIDNPSRCIQWRAEFEELKIQQQKANNRLGECILDFFRLKE